MILWIGGFFCGLAAGAAARYGQLCSMGAIEDALVGGNSRGLKAWGLALATAIIATQAAQLFGVFSPLESIYASTALDWPIALVGGILFGLGMALVGTCGFGLLVRLGGGDLRALVSAILLGIFAFAISSGALAPMRAYISGISIIEFESANHIFLPNLLQAAAGTTLAILVCGFIVCFLISSALSDGRLLRRPRLMASAIVLGLAVTGGWVITGMAYDSMSTAHVESLSFVAPVGRAILQLMSDQLRDTNFDIACVLGVMSGSLLVAIGREEFRWEAFDDAREMRRHILGAALMGLGGVLAKGCTIGQGLSAGSLLSLSSPIVVTGIFIGARLGLGILLSSPRGALLTWRI